MTVRNQKTTINNKVRAIEQVFVLDPVKQNVLGLIQKIENVGFSINILPF